MAKLNQRWRKRIHPGWFDPKTIPNFDISCPLSKDQWTNKGFSIIGPCMATMEMYELHDRDGDGVDVYRFNTLKEAKNFAKNLI